MELRVGTFNVRQDTPVDGDHRWDKRLSRLLDELRDWSPDVLGLQEPSARQLEQILNGLPQYRSIGVGRDDGRSAGEFSAILYAPERLSVTESGTFWLSETPEKEGSHGWGCHHARICTWAHFTDKTLGRSFYHYNTHLDHAQQQAREEGASLILSRIRQRATADPVLVTGDFNAGPGNPAITRMMAPEAPSLRDIFSVLDRDNPSSEGTFHGFTGEPHKEPIDFIFVTPEWDVLEAQVLRGDGRQPFVSDHFPVSATLRLAFPLG